jgi:hypothetical protein
MPGWDNINPKNAILRLSLSRNVRRGSASEKEDDIAINDDDTSILGVAINHRTECDARND